MKFEQTDKVTHPATDVLDLMIDRMEEIVPFLPNVESIETLSRETLADGRVKVVRRWQGTSQTAPAAVRPFASKESLAWTDTALWDRETYEVEWVFESNLSKLYDCGGVSSYKPHPDDPEEATRIVIAGHLEVFPDKMPGIPKFLGKKLAPQIEKFVVKMITPNVMETAQGVQRYFDDRTGGGGDAG